MTAKLPIIAAVFLLICGSAVDAQDFDLVILGGRVIDPETMLDDVLNVGVRNGKIAAITKNTIEGSETIDAAGHVVSPGFVDTHNHVVTTPFGQKLALRDGVTTPLELEVGVLPVGRWYASMKGRSQTNYGATASLEGAREMVLNPDYKTVNGATVNDTQEAKTTHLSMAFSKAVATDAQVKQILDLVEEGLKQGGLGIGYTPGYMVRGRALGGRHRRTKTGRKVQPDCFDAWAILRTTPTQRRPDGNVATIRSG